MLLWGHLVNEDPAPYTYVPPIDIYHKVKPGAGPTEFMDFRMVPEDRLLRTIARTIDDGREYPLSVIGMIFRFLGSPRAWQLGGEDVVLKLSADHQKWLLDAALTLPAQLEPGDRYFFCPDPEVIYRDIETMPPRDHSNVAVIEQWYWLNSMPGEFVERIIALLKEKNGEAHGSP